MRGTGINEKVREMVLARDSYDDRPCCVYCGNPYHLHIHHFVERSRGGKGVEQNLITLCWACHTDLHNGNEMIKKYCMDYLEEHYADWIEKEQILK